MKIIGTEEEIRTFCAIAARGRLDDMTKVSEFHADGKTRYSVSFLDEQIAFIEWGKSAEALFGQGTLKAEA